MTIEVDHDSMGVERRTLYQSECTCGWKSGWIEDSSALADEALDDHLLNVEAPPPTSTSPAEPERPKVVDLMEALEASLAAVKKGVKP